MALKLSSEAFASGAEIPARYTCKGIDVSPPLNWQGVPEATRSLALIVDTDSTTTVINPPIRDIFALSMPLVNQNRIKINLNFFS